MPLIESTGDIQTLPHRRQAALRHVARKLHFYADLLESLSPCSNHRRFLRLGSEIRKQAAEVERIAEA